MNDDFEADRSAEASVARTAITWLAVIVLLTAGDPDILDGIVTFLMSR